MIAFASVEAGRHVGAVLDQLLDRLEREVRVDRAGAVADQQREVRDVARLAGLADETALRAQAFAHQVVVHGAGREQHRDRRELGRDAAIREHEQVHAVAHRLRGLAAQRFERAAQTVAARRRP